MEYLETCDWKFAVRLREYFDESKKTCLYSYHWVTGAKELKTLIESYGSKRDEKDQWMNFYGFENYVKEPSASMLFEIFIGLPKHWDSKELRKNLVANPKGCDYGLVEDVLRDVIIYCKEDVGQGPTLPECLRDHSD
jgi:hypothetical protein